MMQLPAIVFFALLLALPLTLIVSSVVLLLYRNSLLRMMGRMPAPTATAKPVAAPAPQWREAWHGDPGDALAPALSAPLPGYRELRRRETRFWAVLSVLWLLIGLSGAVPYLLLLGQPLSPLRILGLAIAWASPGWMALGLIARLPWRRAIGLILACVLIPAGVIWCSFRDQSAVAAGQLLSFLLTLQGVPLAALTLLVGVPALRATAPLLYLPVLLVTVLALGGQGALVALNALGASPHLLRLVPSSAALLLIGHLLPVVAGLWLIHALSRQVARRYRERHFSDLSYTLATSAGVVLLFAVIPSWSANNGAPALLIPLLAWLWIPVGFTLMIPRLLSPPPGPPPTLLVLRLFRRPGPVGWLFDQVVQRWRFLGPVLLISGADLALRTLDAHELSDFIDGRLDQRFIATPAALQHQIGADANDPDHDGRYRVHDLCCYDSSWQGVLEALLQRSQLVLMDLRGFQAHNSGCLHELHRLAASPGLRNVVLLFDRDTDRDTADAALAGAPAVVWVPERQGRHQTMEALLRALCR
jgi:hypothetical protein